MVRGNETCQTATGSPPLRPRAAAFTSQTGTASTPAKSGQFTDIFD